MAQKIEKSIRNSSAALDKILGKSFKVLDDGFIRVVDYLGTDESIVQAARVSYGKGTKSKRSDEQLIRYLMRHLHTSPLEMCELKLHIRVPMDCWRQWIRHRTASVNEYSTRYSLAIDSAYGTKADAWRLQGIQNKQGSEGVLEKDLGKEFTRTEQDLHALCKKTYTDRIEAGIAREQARKDLPLATYTEAYWKIDLHNLLHFLRLRMETKAQLEIREYSETIAKEVLRRWVPMTYKAFLDYWMNSVTLSSTEQIIVSKLAAAKPKKAIEAALEIDLIEKQEKGFKRKIECLELEAKLTQLGFSIPWL